MSITYCMSDLHGKMILLDKAIEYLNETHGENHWYVYFLGDAIDRGRDGYAIANKLLRDRRFIYIKGNHEDLFVRAAHEFYSLRNREYSNYTLQEMVDSFGDISNLMNFGNEMRLYYQNLGKATFKDWLNDGAPAGFVRDLNELPLTASEENYDMCHAGCRKYCWGLKEKYADRLLWSRDHYEEPWFEGRILVFGHEPVQYLTNSNSTKIVKSVRFRKIAIDAMSAYTDCVNLFNMNTEECINIDLTRNPEVIREG